MEESIIFFVALFAIVAYMYSSVGHGGASGYIALMTWWSLSAWMIKPMALTLNLLVSMVAFIHYARANHFRWRLFVGFAMSSVPFAFLGGLFDIGIDVYRVLLSVFLLFASVRLLFSKAYNTSTFSRPFNLYIALGVGAGLGFVSGLIGIGGGIILSPLILMIGWANQKETAAVSALFIFVNSLAGLIGQSSAGVDVIEVYETVYFWVIIVAVGAGAALGAYAGARRYSNNILKYILSAVLFSASLKLLVQVVQPLI